MWKDGAEYSTRYRLPRLAKLNNISDDPSSRSAYLASPARVKCSYLCFQSFLRTFLTARRISLIHQQYTSGFKKELIKTAVAAQLYAIFTVLVYPIDTSMNIVTQIGR